MQNPVTEQKENEVKEIVHNYNLELITKSLLFVNNTAKNVVAKNELVQDTYFDFLGNKQKVKSEMIENGFIEPKNKDVANYYFKSILGDLSTKAFNDFNIEIKEVVKEGKDFNYSFKNVDKTKSNEEFVVAFKELFKLYKTLILLISTNNLALRIKLFDYKGIKRILDNLVMEIDLQGDKTTLKSAINSIPKDSNDIAYLETIKSYLKLVQELPTENIEPLFKSFQKLTLESKVKLLEQLKADLKTSRVETLDEAENTASQTPSSAVYSIEEE